MPTIYVPTFAFFKNDAEKMLEILEKEVPKEFKIGLEIGGRPDHFNSKGLERISENIKSVAKGVKTIVHGFSGLKVYDIANMSTEEGKELLKKYSWLAKDLDSEYIHVHGAAGYRGLVAPKDKPEVLSRIRENLLEGLAKSGGIPIGIENIPSPSACDFDTNPETVWSDYVEQIGDCLKVVEGTDLKVTLDTAHYGINREDYIDLIEPAKLLGTHLNHIHAVDCSGYWEPNVSKAYDGSIPGDGRIGKDSFKHFFTYIAKEHPNMNVCLEIRPADFKDPSPEFKESIKRVCGWMS